MIGPGKYNDLLTAAREGAKAEGAILIIINGEHGLGFSCQLPMSHLLSTPKLLRDVADKLEADYKKGQL